MPKTFNVKTQFVFNGSVEVQANTKQEAIEKVNKNLGLVIGGNIHSSDPNIVDWEFNTHPTKKAK